MSRTENSESQLVRHAFLGGAACAPAAACDLSPPCTQRVRTGGTLHWWPERTRSESAGGVLSTESSLGLSFVAQPAREKSVSRQKQKAPLAWGSGVLHIHLTSPRTPPPPRHVYKEQAADWRGVVVGNMHPVCHQHSQNSAPPQAPKWQRPW